MRFGMNLLMWTDTLNDEMLPLLDQMKEIGYDAVEIPCFDLDNLGNYTKWGKRFDELGLSRSGTAVRGPDQNMIDPDPADVDPDAERLESLHALLAAQDLTGPQTSEMLRLERKF